MWGEYCCEKAEYGYEISKIDKKPEIIWTHKRGSSNFNYKDLMIIFEHGCASPFVQLIDKETNLNDMFDDIHAWDGTKYLVYKPLENMNGEKVETGYDIEKFKNLIKEVGLEEKEPHWFKHVFSVNAG